MKHSGTLVSTTDNRTSFIDKRQHTHLELCWETLVNTTVATAFASRPGARSIHSHKKHLKRIIAVYVSPLKGARESLQRLRQYQRERERERDIGHGDCYSPFGQESVLCGVAGWFTGRQGKEKSVESTECQTMVRQSATTTQ